MGGREESKEQTKSAAKEKELAAFAKKQARKDAEWDKGTKDTSKVDAAPAKADEKAKERASKKAQEEAEGGGPKPSGGGGPVNPPYAKKKAKPEAVNPLLEMAAQMKAA